MLCCRNLAPFRRGFVACTWGVLGRPRRRQWRRPCSVAPWSRARTNTFSGELSLSKYLAGLQVDKKVAGGGSPTALALRGHYSAASAPAGDLQRLQPEGGLVHPQGGPFFGARPRALPGAADALAMKPVPQRRDASQVGHYTGGERSCLRSVWVPTTRRMQRAQDFWRRRARSFLLVGGARRAVPRYGTVYVHGLPDVLARSRGRPLLKW